jgi:hypothetical protein
MMNQSKIIKLIVNLSVNSSKTNQPNQYRINLKQIANDFSGYPLAPSVNVDLESIKSSYIAGVFFMLCVIGLLLYVNLYYEYCFRDTIIEMTQSKMCFCLKFCFIVRKKIKKENVDYLRKENLKYNQNHRKSSNQTLYYHTRNAKCQY